MKGLLRKVGGQRRLNLDGKKKGKKREKNVGRSHKKDTSSLSTSTTTSRSIYLSKFEGTTLRSFYEKEETILAEYQGSFKIFHFDV